MHCFTHPEIYAIGICLTCGRGVCRDCAAEAAAGRMVACRGRCELESKRLLDLRDFSFAQPSLQSQVLKRQQLAFRSSAVFLVLVGAVFIGAWMLHGARFQILAVLGSGMVLWGAFQLIRTWKPMNTDQFRLCPNCGYNVSRNTTGRCPECNWNL